MKKIKGRIWLSIMMMCILVVSAIPVAADGISSAEVYAVADKTQVLPGETLTVTIKVDNFNADGSTASKGMQFRFDYDSTKLTYSSKTNGEVYRAANTKNIKTSVTGQVGVIATYDKNMVDVSGDLVTLTFTVNPDAEGEINFQFLNSVGKIEIEFGAVPLVRVAEKPLAKILVSADKNSVSRGEEVTYSFNLPAIADFKGIQFDFDYDETQLEYVSYKKGEAFDESLSGGVNNFEEDGNAVVGVLVVYGEEIEFEGNICTITFQARVEADASEVINAVTGIQTTSEIDSTADMQNASVKITDERISTPLTNTVLTENGEVYEVKIASKTVESGQIFIAIYSNKNKLLVTKKWDCLGNRSFNTTLPVCEDASFAKVFVFKGINGLQPFATAETVSITRESD